MQHVKNAIGGNAMKMLKMHQNAIKCTRMRMGKINTTFGKKQQQSLGYGGGLHRGLAAEAVAVNSLPLLTPAPPSGGQL